MAHAHHLQYTSTHHHRHNLYYISKHEKEQRTAVTSSKLGEWMDAKRGEVGTGKEMSFDAFG
jgi:hypothetical protein